MYLDCEQIITCSYNENNVGTIDGITVQGKIVDIMEGGEEAFNQRKMIYELWKH